MPLKLSCYTIKTEIVDLWYRRKCIKDDGVFYTENSYKMFSPFFFSYDREKLSKVSVPWTTRGTYTCHRWTFINIYNKGNESWPYPSKEDDNCFCNITSKSAKMFEDILSVIAWNELVCASTRCNTGTKASFSSPLRPSNAAVTWWRSARFKKDKKIYNIGECKHKDTKSINWRRCINALKCNKNKREVNQTYSFV